MIRLIIVATASIGLIVAVAFLATRLVRSRRRGLSIRLQVFLALASIVGAFAVGLGLMVIDRIEARAVRFATHAADEKASVIAKLLGAEMEQYQLTLGALAQQLPRRASPHTLEGVELLALDERVLFRSPRGLPGPSEPTVTVLAPIVERDHVKGYVVVTKTTIAVQRLLKDFAPTVLVISLLLCVVAALAAVWIGHMIAGPIEALTRFAGEVSAGRTRAVPPPPTTGREVMRLTQSIDSMRRQLEGRPFVEAFAADLSHELKNPVAAIRAAAEVLEDSALEEPEQARRFVRRIREAVARIERLLGDLLSLARIEARGVEGFARLNLSRLVQDVIHGLDSRGRLEISLEPGLHVRGDSGWLTRAVSNLIDNGLIHASGSVRVQLEAVDRQVLLRVSNPGSIDKHTRSRLFGRFVTTRADKGGSGLGLAIVRAVAEAHRGQIRLLESGPPDVCFELRLPRA